MGVKFFTNLPERAHAKRPLQPEILAACVARKAERETATEIKAIDQRVCADWCHFGGVWWHE
jgi:hypothetical protein